MLNSFLNLFVLLLRFMFNAGAGDSVWPPPQQISGNGGPFPISPAFSINTNSKSGVLGRGITRYLEIITRQTDSVFYPANESFNGISESLTNLVVTVAKDDETLSFETSYHYSLIVETSGKAHIMADSPYGALYGLETFSQLVVDGSLVYSEVKIIDFPEYPHRGLMLDTGRRFFPIQLLFNILDAMSYIKLNVLHFHLSDFCRFSVESILYPDLRNNATQIYTQEDVLMIVNYAKDRGIRVIPEVESGGHANGMKGLENKPHGLKFCNKSNSLMLYNDPQNVTLTTMKGILKEMAALFPDQGFHLGMDETLSVQNCTLNNTKSLETALLQYVQDLNKTVFAWEEVLLTTEAAIQGTVVQAWRSASIKEIVDKGFRAVYSLSSRFYLNDLNNKASGFWTDIAEGLTADEKKMLLGGEMAMWTDDYCYISECITNIPTTAGWMFYGPKYDAQFAESVSALIWPRAIIGAGSFWNYQVNLDFEGADLTSRYQQQQWRFKERNILACPYNCACDYNNKCGQPYPRQ